MVDAVIPLCFSKRNLLSSAKVSFRDNDRKPPRFYCGTMAIPHHDWYFAEWLAYYGMKQARVIEALDWPKSKVSKLHNRMQPYDRDSVNALADLLNIAPFELLMHPDDAMALRRFRQDAIRIAADTRTPFTAEPTNLGTGTHG